MSDTLNASLENASTDPTNNTDTNESTPSELDLLKERATMMGITFHPSIGIEKLKEKIEATLSKIETIPVDTAANEPMPEYQKHKYIRDEATKLIRVVVNCMNPAKQLWEGEIFTVSNRAIGTVKKFVPFNADAGYHIPNVIYQAMLERQCPVYYTVTDPRTGFKTRKSRLIKEFSITVLDPLTTEELEELARQQAIGNNID